MMKAQRESLTLVLFAAALAAIPTLTIAQQATGKPIKVGAIISLTGGAAVVGIPERNGILLGLKTVNAGGGINGRPLQILIEDDGTSPDAAVTKINALVYTEKVKAILGATAIGNTVAMGGITAPLNLPQIAYSGIGPAVEKQRTCLFHMLPPQELNARALLAYATKGLGAKKVAVLHDTGYGQVVMNALKTVMGDFQVQLVAVEKFEIAATDVTTQAAKIKAVAPDAVLVIAGSATPFRNTKQVKIAAPVIAAIGSSSYENLKAMGVAAEGVVFAEFVVSEDPLAHQKQFVADYQKEYGTLPKNYEAAGYDSVIALANALKKVGADADNAALCSAIRSKHSGVIGTYDFSAPDMTGLGISDYNYSKVIGGKFTRLAFKVGK